MRSICFLLIYTSILWGSEDFDFYKNNPSDFFIREIDINADGQKEFVVSSTKNRGNELVFFKQKDKDYIPILDSLNLSVDGGDSIFDIYSINEKVKDPIVMEIVTTRPSQEYHHYIKYLQDEKRWVIAYTQYYEVFYEANAVTMLDCTFLYTNLYLDKLNDPYYEDTDLITSINIERSPENCQIMNQPIDGL